MKLSDETRENLQKILDITLFTCGMVFGFSILGIGFYVIWAVVKALFF